MAVLKLSLSKSPQNEVLVYGNYESGDEPVFIERVIVEELDDRGNTIGAYSHYINRTIGPGQGSYLLISQPINGKASRASARYIEIEEEVKSDILQLS